MFTDFSGYVCAGGATGAIEAAAIDLVRDHGRMVEQVLIICMTEHSANNIYDII